MNGMKEKHFEFSRFFVGFRGSPAVAKDSIHEIPLSRTKKD